MIKAQIKVPSPPSTREAILAAAAQLFSAKGFAGTSMSDLAEKLALSKAAIYHHFESKEVIFQTLLQSSNQDLEMLIGKHKKFPSNDLEKSEILLDFADFMISHRDVVRLALSEMQDDVMAQGPHGHQSMLRLQELLAGKKPTSESKMRARIAMGIIFLGIVPPPHAHLPEEWDLDLTLLVDIAVGALGVNR